MAMTTVNGLQHVASFLCGTGAGMIVTNVVKATTPAYIPRSHKALIFLGGLALSGIMSDVSESYSYRKIDEIFGIIKKAVEAQPQEDKVTEKEDESET